MFSQEILVTAHPIPEERQHIFHRADIISSQAQTLPELLEGTAGLFPHSQGAFGKTSSLSIRGMDSGRALILIDGVEVRDSTAVGGDSRLEFISLDNVETIEGLKGKPRPPLWA